MKNRLSSINYSIWLFLILLFIFSKSISFAIILNDDYWRKYSCDIQPPETFSNNSIRVMLRCLPGTCSPEPCRNITVNFSAVDNLTPCSQLDISVSGAISGNSKCSFSKTRCFGVGGYTIYATSRDLARNVDPIPAVWYIKVEPPPGCDCPDEAETVSTITPDMQQTGGIPVIAVFNTGYGEQVKNLLSIYKEPAAEVYVDMPLSEYKKYKVLIIP